MLTPPVPDYFQEESEAALRSQVEWLEQQVGVGDPFFARLLRVEEDTFRDWRLHRGPLPPDRQASLRDLWQTILHLLSFLNFDELRVRHLLEHCAPLAVGAEASFFAPPWSGSSLRVYLEIRGPEALADVDRWVTAFRFGDPYAA